MTPDTCGVKKKKQALPHGTRYKRHETRHTTHDRGACGVGGRKSKLDHMKHTTRGIYKRHETQHMTHDRGVGAKHNHTRPTNTRDSTKRQET